MPSAFDSEGLFVFANLPEPWGLRIYKLGYRISQTRLLLHKLAACYLSRFFKSGGSGEILFQILRYATSALSDCVI